MSRTDAHAPYWTWATWYEPSHHLWCENRVPEMSWRARRAGPRHYFEVRACNLPEHPVRHAGARTRVHVGLCTWEPVWPKRRQVRWLHVGRVPKWYVDHVWNNAERVRVRDELNGIRKEYSAWSYFDGDFPNWQHRHGATRYWD